MTTTQQTYELTIKRTIDDKLLEGIIDTAVNGGINYWCHATVVPESLELKIHPTEETKDDFAPMILTPMGVLLGLERLCKKRYCNHRFHDLIMTGIADNDGSFIDAEAADVIVQVALFDEIVYFH